MQDPYFYGQYIATIRGEQIRVVLLPNVPNGVEDDFIRERFRNSMKLTTVDLLLKRWRLAVCEILRKRKLHKELLKEASWCHLVSVSPDCLEFPDVSEFVHAATGTVVANVTDIEKLLVTCQIGGKCRLLIAFFGGLSHREDALSFEPLSETDVLDVLKQLERD